MKIFENEDEEELKLFNAKGIKKLVFQYMLKGWFILHL
jgi:hypothetical protein